MRLNGTTRPFPAVLRDPREGKHREVLVDLHLEQPVPVIELLELGRLTSLSDEWWRRLVVHTFRLQSRLKPETVFTLEFLHEA